MIAQEAQEVVPHMVCKDENGYLGIEMMGYVPLLVEEVKSLRVRVRELEGVVCP